MVLLSMFMVLMVCLAGGRIPQHAAVNGTVHHALVSGDLPAVSGPVVMMVRGQMACPRFLGGRAYRCF